MLRRFTDKTFIRSITADTATTDAESSGRRLINAPTEHATGAWLVEVNVVHENEAAAQPVFCSVFLGSFDAPGSTTGTRVHGPLITGWVRGDASIRQKHGLHWSGRVPLITEQTNMNYLYFALQNLSATVTPSLECVWSIEVES